MTRLRGPKFGYSGEDYEWYALKSDPPHMHLNMRRKCSVPPVNLITYNTVLHL